MSGAGQTVGGAEASGEHATAPAANAAPATPRTAMRSDDLIMFSLLYGSGAIDVGEAIWAADGSELGAGYV